MPYENWGGQHAGLWAALLAAGRTVEVVIVGWNANRLGVHDGCGCRTLRGHGRGTRRAGAQRPRDLVPTASRGRCSNDAVLTMYGGLTGVAARCARAGDRCYRDHAGGAGDHHGTDMAFSEDTGMSPLVAHPARALVAESEARTMPSPTPGSMA